MKEKYILKLRDKPKHGKMKEEKMKKADLVIW